MKSPRSGLIFPLLALALCASVACNKQPQPQASDQIARERVAGKRGGAIVYRLTSPPRTFNPLLAIDEASLTASFFLLSGRLIDFDHDTQSYVPGLAESWKRNEDGRAVELTLREGLKFSDGHLLTTQDVAFTMQAIYDERTDAPILRDAMKIDGKQIEVTALDHRNIRFVFPEPVAAPESYISNLPVLPRHALEESFKQGKLGQRWGVAADPQSIIASGAFTVESSTPGERVVFRRNPYYWKRDANGVELPYLDSLTLEVIGDINNAMMRLGQTTIDIIDRLRATDYAALRSSQTARSYDLGPGLSTDHLWFNLNDGERNGQPIVSATKRAWFGDGRFRRAVSHAIDRDSIAESTLQGIATPLYQFMTPANRNWVAADLPRTDYSLDRARALLQEAGFTLRGTEDAPELYDARGNRVEWTLIVPTENEPRKLMAAFIQQDLSKLGMTVHVAPIEFQSLTERWSKSYDYDAILLGLSLTDTEPSSYTNFLRSDSAGHQWHPKQSKPATQWETRIDELVTAQARARDAERRRALIREIQIVMSEQLPVIPIVSRHILVAASPRIGNYRPSNILPFSLWNAEELFVK
ncbi:MAG: ABC transporter substrate-binding protein [Acidobacteriota bacterium]